jgi:hypothetical protein
MSPFRNPSTTILSVNNHHPHDKMKDLLPVVRPVNRGRKKSMNIGLAADKSILSINFVIDRKLVFRTGAIYRTFGRIIPYQ